MPVFPTDGQTGVAVDATLSWTPVDGVTAYNITIGTTPQGSEILPLASVGSSTRYTPPQGFPENTTLYVTIYLFNLSQGNTECTTYSFTTADVTTPPGCTEMLSPADGAEDVPVATRIRWRYSPTATAYRVRVGTTPGGQDLVTEQVVSGALELAPPADLPAETTIYVRIVPENENGVATACPVDFSFTTGPLATLPICAGIIYPQDGESNVPLTPVIQWNAVPGADGYVVSIGTSPFENDILDNADLRNTTETPIIRLEPNKIFFITITPYNTAGQAQGCTYTTFSTILGCGPYFDADGNLIDLRPEVSFPEQVGICSDAAVNTVSATDAADGYRWYVIDSPGRERLLAEGPDFDIPGEGQYRHEAFRTYSSPSGDFECTASQVFEAVASEAPSITDTRVTLGVGVISLEVQVQGTGQYEYALGSPDGPYQDSNRFTNLPLDTYTVYVRDKNGCGLDQARIQPDLSVEGFPRFFTPNGDGTNDTWQYVVPASGDNPVQVIYIFDRYGNLLASLGPGSAGWDGTFNGRPVPPSDYWYRAVDRNGGVVMGHFVLKR
ncbi:T9SS type B sorting domain-containing protein [Robiginitalea sp. M366]|uniref:T9SS type B sorting domain-containing protein n=1 Tax=Robiginitalea aestuariiviva TaxID=3036903 RepID=UPI00240DFD5C|nr:T9SS type B sorting domain-containing protein [Robiginitalea aestuariiviva]MDG1572355.1 T9SS type B sorting domain-containing protein [Robiginitalea aestuariiviva]